MKRLIMAKYSIKKQLKQAKIFLKKAKEDQILVEEVINSERVSDEIIGYHCQQATEKLLKAVLTISEAKFRGTHNLTTLMDYAQDAGFPVPKELSILRMLTIYGTELRYDDVTIDKPFDRKNTLAQIKKLHTWAEELFEQKGSSFNDK